MPSKTSYTERVLGSINTFEMTAGLGFISKIFSRPPQKDVATPGRNYSKVATEKEPGAEFSAGNGLLSGVRHVNAAATAMAGRSGPPASQQASLPIIGAFAKPIMPAQAFGSDRIADIPGKLVAHALEEICGEDRQRAAVALQRLKVGPLPLEQMEIPSSDARTPARPVADAYRLAQVLARSEVGYAQLLEWRPEYRSDDWQVERARRTLLKATDHFLTTDTAAAGKGEHVISWHAAQAAQKLLQDPRHDPGVLTQIERTDYFSFNQGFTSDAPGSPLYLSQQRLHKTVNQWLPRATTKPHGVVEIVKSKLAPVFGARKNPFDGLRRFGTSAHSDWLIKVQESFDKQMVSAITNLEALAHNRMNASLRQSRQGPHAADSLAMAARHAELAARLAYWKDKATPQPGETRNTRAILEKPSLEQASGIIGHAQQLLQEAGRQSGLPPREIAASLQQINADPKALRRRFVPDFKQLQKMRTALLGESGDPAAGLAHDLHEHRHITQFNEAFAAAEKIHSGNTIRSEPNVESIAASIKEFYNTTNVGNSVTFADGGVYGLDSTRIGIPVGHGGVFVAPDVQLTDGKAAIVGLSSSMYSGNLILSTEHKVPATAGVVGGIGHRFGPFSLSASVAGAFGIERIHRKGLALSARIQFNEDGTREKAADGKEAWRHTMNGLTGFLANRQHVGKDRTALYNAFVNDFFNEPNLSVRWQDDLAREDRAALNFGAGVRLYAGDNRIGPMASVGFKFVPQNQQRVLDLSGQSTRESSASGRSVQGGASLSLVETFPDAGPVGLPSAPLVGTSATFGTTGQRVTISLSRDAGRYMPLNCNRTVEYRTPQAYLRAIEFNKDSWIALLGEKRFNAHIEEIRSGAFSGKNRSFYEHYFLRADVARRLDALQALRESYAKREMDPDRPSHHIKRIEQEVAALLADEASWEKMALFGTEATGRSLSRGVNFMLKFKHARSVAERCEMFWLAPEMKELVQRAQGNEKSALANRDRHADKERLSTVPLARRAPELTVASEHYRDAARAALPQREPSSNAALVAHQQRYARIKEAPTMPSWQGHALMR